MRIPGVIHRTELGQYGITDVTRRRLLRDGRMDRAGTWYVTADASEALVGQLQLGVRPTCVTAAEYHGLWVPLHEGEHVYRPRVPGIALPPGTVVHGSRMRSWPDPDPVAELALALEHAARCLPVRDTAILFESALHTDKLSLPGARELVASFPRELRTPLSRVNPLAESGTETAVRWWLESVGVRVRPQVLITGVGRVDLKLGDRWIIECDSRRYHDTDEQYHRDRARDLRLRALGYEVTRLTWEQVFLDWARTREFLPTVIRRGDHRRRLPA